MIPPPMAEAFERDGCFLKESVVPIETVKCLRADLERAIDSGEKRVAESHKDYGMILVCPLHGRAFIDLLAQEEFIEPFNALLTPGSIVYAYTSSSMAPRSGNYSSRIHVDCPRLIPNYMTNMGGILLLDEFHEENGATWYLPGSHIAGDAPDESHFWKNAKRVLGKPGDAFYFNARLWHAGGQNMTDRWRHAVTVNMCRPFMKQRIDLPRALEKISMNGVPDSALQKLGFYAQAPASLGEYYLPPEKRKYRQKVE